MSEHASDPGRRVLLVAASNRRRGAEVFTSQLQRSLDDRGWQVDAVALTASADTSTVDIPALTAVEPSQAGRLNREILRALRTTMREMRPPLVVAMGGPTLRYAVLANVGMGSKLAYFAIGEPKYWLSSPVATLLNRLLYRMTDVIIAVSRMTATQLVDIEPAVADRVRVAYTGVDDEMFEVETDAHDGPARLLFVGSLSAEKDPLLALQAVSELPDAQLRLVGAGPLAGEVSTAAERLGIGDRVEIVGPVDQISDHLAWADLLLLTSRTEGLPGVVLEGAAAGVPAIAVEVGGLREAIVDGVTGLLVRRDAEQIASAISGLLADRQHLADMGVSARQRALDEFRLEQSVDRFESVLEGVIA